MEFFDSLVLPQSSEHIALLQYILMLVFFILLPFSGLVVSGTIISLFYSRKGNKENNKEYLSFARDIIQATTINKSAGLLLGIVPVLAVLMVYSQLLHASGSYIISFLFLAFLLYSSGLVLIYLYRYALVFNEVFVSVKTEDDNSVVKSELATFAAGSEMIKKRAGIYGLIFILISLLLVFGSISLSINPAKWAQVHNIFNLVFSLETLVRFALFICGSLALTGGYLLFVNLYWEGGKKDLTAEQVTLIKKVSVKNIFVFSILQLLFLFADLILLPNSSLSTSIFGYTVIAILLLFLVYNLTYVMFKDNSIKFSGYVFVLLVCVFSSGIIKDQLAMANSTAIHSLTLNTEFEKHVKTLQASIGTENNGADGEQIFKKICSACHKFDQKLVGPPYKETLPKYEGNMDKLVAFIKNPVKMNPNYPPMPNQGLKPNEAKAVAKYIMDNYKK